MNAYSQIGISYSIGSIGSMSKASSFSGPVIITGENCFKVTNIDGRAMLVKMDPVEQFAKGYKVNVQTK